MGCLDGAPSLSLLAGVHSLITWFRGEVEGTGKRKSPVNIREVKNGKESYKQFILKQKYFTIFVTESVTLTTKKREWKLGLKWKAM